MDIITYKRPTFTYYVEIAGISMCLYDLIETLEDLEECDGCGSALVIYDTNIKNFVIENGLGRENIRGGVGYKDKDKITTLLTDLYELDTDKFTVKGN